MLFEETRIPGAFIVSLDPIRDERGAFSRVFCHEEFNEHGIANNIAQVNLSSNRFAGTLRGLHYQLPPSWETKIVRCIQGALFDVVVDLRLGSPTFGKWASVELSADNERAFVVPEGCAHGFQTLEDETKVLYFVSQPHDSGRERGVSYADPDIGIHWPLPVRSISNRDMNQPRFDDAELPEV